jgi:hypothetical protein
MKKMEILFVSYVVMSMYFDNGLNFDNQFSPPFYYVLAVSIKEILMPLSNPENHPS